MADAFFFFRPEEVKETTALLDNLRARTDLDLGALATLEWDHWFQSRTSSTPVYVLCIGESGVLVRQLKLIEEAVKYARSRYGFTPFLIRVYIPGAEEPSLNLLLQKSGFKNENVVDFRKGLNDEDALKRLEDLILSVRLRLREDTTRKNVFVVNRREPTHNIKFPDEVREKSHSLTRRTFLAFTFVGLVVLLVNAGLALIVLYCGVLASLVVSHRYGIQTGYFLISPSNTYLGILVSAGLVITALVATVEQALKAF